MNPKFLPIITILAFTALGGCAVLGALWSVDHEKLQAENQRLQTLAIQERDYKSQLQELLDNNLNSSSELVQATDTLIKEVKSLSTQVKGSFRVLNGNVELLPGVNAKLLENTQAQVEIEIDNTDAKITSSIKQKDSINNRVNAIFSGSDQNQQNRADPREGVRSPSQLNSTDSNKK